MSDNWNPPPGRRPHEPEPEGEQPTDGPASGPPRRDGQSPTWWTESADKPQEYLQPGEPGPNRPYGPNVHPPAGAPPGRPGPQHAGPQPAGPPQGQPGPGRGGSPQGPPGQSNPWWPAASGPYPPYQQGGQPQFPQGGRPPAPGEPGWQYPPIPIPKPPGPGRRRKPRQTSKGLLIGLVVLAVLVVGSGVTYALQHGGNDHPAPVSADTPSASPSDTPSSTPTPSPAPTVRPKPSPKPKPKPRTPTAFELVARNKVYSAGAVQASRCAEPPYRPTTAAATKAYYNRMLPCLNRTWWLELRKVGIAYRPPRVVVYGGNLKTPCGIERGTRGFYCGGNEVIYMPFAVDYKNYQINPMYTRAWMLNTFAHEYGHHVQQMTGIFGASFARQASMKDPNMRLLESRRRELQASCLGSAYLGADAAFIPMTGTLLSSWKFAIANAGDEFSKPKVRDHGSKANHNFWSIRGYTSKAPAYCNTWTSNPQFLS